MKKITSLKNTAGARVVFGSRDSTGSSRDVPLAAVSAFPGMARSGHDTHTLHGADVEHTYEYRFFYLLVFAVFLFVGCVRYVLALSSVFTSSRDNGKPTPRPFVEGRSAAQIYVPYIFQL